jgi:hypothetical protein
LRAQQSGDVMNAPLAHPLAGLALVTATECRTIARTSLMTLTKQDIQHLTAAATRSDHLIPTPDALSPQRRRAALARLVRSRLAVEVEVSGEALVWRRSEGSAIGLHITRDGLAVLSAPDLVLPTAPTGAAKITKRSRLVALLGREEGAGMADLVAATDWLPHTVRAALTRLRQSGSAIETLREGGGTLYRIRREPAAGEG